MGKKIVVYLGGHETYTAPVDNGLTIEVHTGDSPVGASGKPGYWVEDSEESLEALIKFLENKLGADTGSGTGSGSSGGGYIAPPNMGVIPLDITRRMRPSWKSGELYFEFKATSDEVTEMLRNAAFRDPDARTGGDTNDGPDGPPQNAGISGDE